MSELKPCPFCGKMPEVYEFNRRKYYGCGRDECYTAGFNGTVTKSIWNTRPIEDELRKRIAELEAELGKDVDLTIVGLRKELLNAQSRIAELEALVDELVNIGDILFDSLNPIAWKHEWLDKWWKLSSCRRGEREESMKEDEMSEKFKKALRIAVNDG